jgi:putative ABC transport system ATP-binding protein
VTAHNAIVLDRGAKQIGDRTLWKEVSHTFDPGSFTCLTGPSGCGKTTLLNCLGLLEPLTSGTITYGGARIDNASARRVRGLRRESFGYLFQNFALVEQWTVYENLQVPLRAARTPKARHGELIGQALESVGLTGRAEAAVHTLSGGEQQRVALARLQLHEPSVVLVDEPTASLDDQNTRMVLERLQHLADGGAVVIVSTHDPAVRDAAMHDVDLS